ncbi:MAG: glycerol-3-phosphate dehydrogenase/oxidase [Ilumatobacter sp.]|nr:glycerol-3-phosphate dehydrogenase/oxidase [Ilumatobacter sp.]
MGARHRFDRDESLRRLGDEHFDVLVIGGGATGAGVALDAASRGLKTALVERHDFADGTSSMSSKMIHGGIRYLQQFEFRLVYQSLSERQRLLRNAPHLVRVLPFVMAIYTSGGMIPKFLSRLLGPVLWFYDITGGAKIGHKHKRLDRDETIAHMPVLDPERIHSGYRYYDAQVDDARMTMAIARTAALDHGAVVANHAPVIALHKAASGGLTGATIDAGARGQIEIRAKAVVNATGVWIDTVDELDGDTERDVRPARGVHVVVPRSLLSNDAAVILSVPGKKASVFAVPWGDHAYIGTTDTDYDGDLDHPYCTAGDVRFLLDSLNASTTDDITPDDVVGTWAGLRPLLRSADDAKTADLSRRHRVTRSDSGLITVAGGKLTTWRQMAEDTVDEVLDLLGRSAACRTKDLPLHGAVGWDTVSAGGVTASVRDRLVGRYGSDAGTLIELIGQEPGLADPLVPGLEYLRAEAVFAARDEMAVTLDDVLSHRTRARLLARDASADAADAVAEILASELGWTADEQAAQVRAYREAIHRERTALELTAPPGPEPARMPGWVPGVARLGSMR